MHAAITMLSCIVVLMNCPHWDVANSQKTYCETCLYQAHGYPVEFKRHPAHLVFETEIFE